MFTVKEVSVLALVLIALTVPRGDGYAVGEIQLRNEDPDGERIINGIEAEAGQFSYTVSLRIQMNAGYPKKHACGGSLIRPSWVLTAAHCVRGYVETDYDIRAGVTQLDDDGAERRKAKKIYRHPHYDAPDNDVALIQLDSPLPITDKHHTTSLLDSTIEEFIGEPVADPQTDNLTNKHPKVHISLVELDNGNNSLSQNCQVSGWGLTSTGGYVSPKLLYASVKFVEERSCVEKFVGFNAITPNMICYGGDDTDTCNGDSGGPLTCKTNDGGVKLVGVTSFGKSCATPGTPGVYARVSAALTWIEETIRDNSSE